MEKMEESTFIERNYRSNDTKEYISKSTSRRQTWTNTLDFLISLVGAAVGLGNVWRFPFLCYRNGGGTFLIPYFIALFFVGLPFQLLEVTLGQIMSRSTIGAWNICPIMKGIGFFQFITQFIGVPCYVIIVSWALYYFCLSFMQPLPWTSCNNTWNSDLCVENISLNSTSGISSRTELWENKVLGLTNGINEVGGFQWQLFMCYAFIWICLFIFLHRGITLSGKVMYPLTIIPYILLFMLLGYVSTMEGTQTGVHYFLTPNWKKLLSTQVWADAARQIIFTLSVGGGITISLASHNHYRKKSYIDGLVTAFINSFTSLIAGLVIFMTLGYMSHVTGIDIDKVSESGVGLAFVTYPLALMNMPFASFWAVVFFLMIVFLGLSSVVMVAEAMFSILADVFPNLAVKGSRIRIYALSVLFVYALIFGSVLMLGNGMYIVQLIDFYNGTRAQFLFMFAQCLALVYIFGGKQFISAVERMYHMKTYNILLIMWGFFTPVTILLAFVSGIAAYTSLSFRRGSSGKEYHYPSLWIGIGWAIELCEFLPVPAYILYKVLRSDGSFSERLQSLIRPQLEKFQEKRVFPNIEILLKENPPSI